MKILKVLLLIFVVQFLPSAAFGSCVLNDVSCSVVRLFVRDVSGQVLYGSGVIISYDKHRGMCRVQTVAHVLKNPTHVYISAPDGSTAYAKSWNVSKVYDAASVEYSCEGEVCVAPQGDLNVGNLGDVTFLSLGYRGVDGIPYMHRGVLADVVTDELHVVYVDGIDIRPGESGGPLFACKDGRSFLYGVGQGFLAKQNVPTGISVFTTLSAIFW